MDISHDYTASSNAIQDFADIIAPVSPDEFLGSYFGKRPLHIPGAADKFTFAMSWDWLNAILNQSAIWSAQSFQLALDSVTVRPDQYAVEGFSRDGTRVLTVDFDKVRALIRQGASLVLNEIETLTPGLRRIAGILGTMPGGKVQANLYCSWQKHQAFDVHYDTHDVFAMQVTGEKVWRIYQRHFKDPINHPFFKVSTVAFHHEHKGQLSMEVTMRPGDVLYIPRGFYHDAMAESDSTVHLSFSVVPMIGLDVVTMLFEQGVLDEVFRQALPRQDERNGAALDEYLMRLAGRLREMLRDPKFRAQLDKNQKNFAFRQQRITLPDDSGRN